MTAALWTSARAWMVGARLYLPEAWLTTDQRRRARIPPTVRFQEKWRLALTLLQQVRASGLTVTAVVADAKFGNNAGGLQINLPRQFTFEREVRRRPRRP